MSVWIKYHRVALPILCLCLAKGTQAVDGRQACSGALPVMVVETEGGTPVTSKDTYVNASYYIEAPDSTWRDWAQGSGNDPLPAKMRGRGNWTWTFDKKPYKLKLPRALPMLGMGKNRHWALLSHPDDGTGFLRNTVAFEVGRRMGLPFTPRQQPVELVLNGEYEGIYVVTETVRIGKNRVEIEPQKDGETDEEAIRLGWLVEIDNYEDPHQLDFDVSRLPISKFRITYHTPKKLNDQQKAYLHAQFQELLECVCVADKQSVEWERYLDLDMLCRYYVASEIVDNVEAFFGSTFLYKPSADGKWQVGPMWDMGHAMEKWHDKDKFIYEGTSWGSNLLTELAKFPRFQQRFRQLYAWFMREHYDAIERYIDDFCATMDAAYRANYLRWNYYGTRTGAEYAAEAKQLLREKVAFLDGVWGRGGV